MIRYPYSRPEITESDITGVVEVLKNGYLTQGSKILEFEQELKNNFKCNHAIVLNSGTAALHLKYNVLVIGPDAGILTSPITFLSTANAAKMCLGINAPEIPLSRFLQSFPKDPVGFSMFLESFRSAKESGLDKVAFLRYPYSNEEALRAFEEVGIEVDMTGFALRERKKKYSPRSKDVKTILEIYQNYNFEE